MPASAQSDSVSFLDEETGITFQSATNYEGITYRLALPADASADKPYDAIIQIVGPIEMGWVAWAWGGAMTYNPLTLVWANGKTAGFSSRQALYVYVVLRTPRSSCRARCTNGQQRLLYPTAVRGRQVHGAQGHQHQRDSFQAHGALLRLRELDRLRRQPDDVGWRRPGQLRLRVLDDAGRRAREQRDDL